MQPTNGRTDYRERLERVRAHIRTNLDQSLDLDQLADIACLSRFHWHRVYRGLTGETVWQTVKRLRLHRAAGELVNGRDPVAAIAARSGYGNVRAFSKAFGDAFGLPPLKYRAAGGHRRYDSHEISEHRAMPDIRIETAPETTIAGFFHLGSYMEISAAFDRLGVEFAHLADKPQGAGLAAVYFHDPDITPVADLHSLAGIMLAPGDTVPPGFERHVQPAGRYAVLVHRGPYAELQKAYSYLFGTWLPESGETPRDVPAVERYLNTPMDTAPQDLVTEIAVGLEEKA